MMTRYLNRSGRSGVRAYQIGADYIQVQFKTGSIYTYSRKRAGIANVNHMKSLAIAGLGLNSFIKKYVNDLYD